MPCANIRTAVDGVGFEDMYDTFFGVNLFNGRRLV